MKLLGVLCFAVALSVSSQADTLYDNTGEGSSGSVQINSSGPLYDSFFSAATPQQLSELDVVLVDQPQIDPTIIATLYQDSGTMPDFGNATTLGTFNYTGPNTYTLSLNGPVLAASTRYWIGLSTNDVTTIAAWSTANDANGIGVGGEYWATTDQNTSAILVHANSDIGRPFQMTVTTAPEPSTMIPLLGVVAAFGVAALRRSRRPR